MLNKPIANIVIYRHNVIDMNNKTTFLLLIHRHFYTRISEVAPSNNKVKC